jgi:geranylgeranyl diphosphate synthase, type I
MSVLARRGLPSTSTKRPPKSKEPANATRSFEQLLGQVKQQTDARLKKVLLAELGQRRELGVEVRSALEAAESLISRGGKRLRAALVFAGYEAALPTRNGASPGVAAAKRSRLDVAVAVELLQAYFLIHDDWMDRDDVRRGGPAVHAALTGQFGSEHLGACGAVLAGDYLVALATGHLAKHTAKHVAHAQLIQCFIEMQLAAVSGQLLDVVGLTRKAERIYDLKTGSYTVSGPLKLGAILAGASPQLLRKLDEFAAPVGFAFQLRDDLLGAFGDPQTTGKPFGSDVKAGKWTWIAEYAHAHASPGKRKLLQRAFGNPEANEEALAAAVAVLESCGARAAAEALIGEQADLARKRLRRLPISEPGRNFLSSAIDAFVSRTS